MRDVLILLIHLIVTVVRLARPGGLRSVLAESLLVKHQLGILNRGRKRAPNLRAAKRFIVGLCTVFMNPARVLRSAIVLKPSTLLHLHHVLAKRKVPHEKVVLALTAASERPEALIDANNSKCSGDGSQTITSEAQLQIHIASDHSPVSEGVPHSHSISDTISRPIYFQLADSLIYMQASLNGSQPLWMMLDTGSSVTIFDEPVSKTLGIRFLWRRECLWTRARVLPKVGIRQPRYPQFCWGRARRSNCGDAASRMVLA